MTAHASHPFACHQWDCNPVSQKHGNLTSMVRIPLASQYAMYRFGAPHSKLETNRPSASTQRVQTTGWPPLNEGVVSLVTNDSPSQ